MNDEQQPVDAPATVNTEPGNEPIHSRRRLTSHADEPNTVRVQGSAISYFSTVAVLFGCVVVAVHLVLGGTSSLALAALNIFDGWPYFLGFASVITGLLLHVAHPRGGKQHVIITVGAAIVGALTLPIAWFYFGFGGIGLDSEEKVTALMAAFVASLTPLVLGVVGGVVSWRSRNHTTQSRVRGMATIALASVLLAAACIIFARLWFPVPGLA